MAFKHIQGQQEVLARMNMAQDAMLDKVGQGVEMACVDVANHAKADHEPGRGHGLGRYENKLVHLTPSIMPAIVKADRKEVVGEVGTNKEYAANVELGTSRSRAYPFLHPALVANKDQFKKRLRQAVYGDIA